MTDLEKLYTRIPAVDCIPGCTDCCGVIPFGTQEEAAAFGPFPLKRTHMGIVSMALDCPNSRAGNCRIHDKRPFVCRLFGTVDITAVGSSESRMVCPHGRKPVKPLTQQQASDLTREYFEIVAKEG